MSGTFRTVSHRQTYAAKYVLPAELGWAFAYRHPEIEDVGPVERGLKQWLRIDVTAPGQMSIPSLAVAELWRDFLRTDGYREFHAEAYGDHRKGDEVTDDDEGLAFTYALARADEDPSAETYQLPQVFRADEESGITRGWRWVITCGHEPCGAEPGVHCVYHRLMPLVPAGRDLPHQPFFIPSRSGLAS